MRVSAEDFKAALGSWATGVTVVTARQDEQVFGLTVSSFSSVSLDPPLVLFCVSSGHRLVDMIRASGGFSVSLLAADQEATSNACARSGREPGPTIEGVEIEPGCADGAPVVAGALASLRCALHGVHEGGDHDIVLGRVIAAEAPDGARGPLLYWRRGYRLLAD
jgi:3-hydroxy-9,10-secoandrosta-1,3,5(10)-triene-9,17-dione monooxygenase reductase component